MITWRRSLLAPGRRDAAAGRRLKPAGLQRPGVRGRPAVAGKTSWIGHQRPAAATQHFPRAGRENPPGLTRLEAERGQLRQRHFTNACMCSPSRATMFTGLYPAQHGVKYTLGRTCPADQYPQVELSTDLTNLATVMSPPGTRSSTRGKVALLKPAGEDWAPRTSGTTASPGGTRRTRRQTRPRRAAAPSTTTGTTCTTTDVDAGQEGVIAFLNARADAEKPWCLVVGLVNPHDVLFYPGPAPWTRRSGSRPGTTSPTSRATSACRRRSTRTCGPSRPPRPSSRVSTGRAASRSRASRSSPTSTSTAT